MTEEFEFPYRFDIREVEDRRSMRGFGTTGSERAREAGSKRNPRKGFGSKSAEEIREAASKGGRKGGQGPKPHAWMSPQSPFYDAEKVRQAQEKGRTKAHQRRRQKRQNQQ